MSRIVVLKGGRSLERQVSLRSGARVQDALERLGHDVTGIDVSHDLVAQLEIEPELAFVALHGRDGEDGTVQELLELLGLPYTGSGVSACIRCADKVLAKHAMLGCRASRRPSSTRSTRPPSRTWARPPRCPRSRSAWPSRSSSSPPARARRWASSSPAAAADVPAALLTAFSYDRKVLLERHVKGRDLAVSVLDGAEDAEPPVALPVVGGGPPRGGLLRLRGALRDRAHPLRLPGRPARRRRRARRRAGAARLLAVRLLRLRARGPDARRGRRTARARGQRDPRPDRDQPAPQAADAAGIGFDDLIARLVDRARRRSPVAAG